MAPSRIELEASEAPLTMYLFPNCLGIKVPKLRSHKYTVPLSTPENQGKFPNILYVVIRLSGYILYNQSITSVTGEIWNLTLIVTHESDVSHIQGIINRF